MPAPRRLPPTGYHEWPLPPVARGCVEAVWSFLAPAAGRWVVPADGRIDLLLRAEVDSAGQLRRVRPLVCGPALRPQWVPAQPPTLLAGLRFVPGRGAGCLGLDPLALRDRVLEGEAAALVFARTAPDLLRATTPLGLVRVLRRQAVQLAQARGDDAPSRHAAAAAAMLASDPALPVSDIARHLGVPLRSLRREALQRIGLPLATLARLQRLQRALRLMATEPTLPLAEVAAASGYSDQAHMTREFGHLAGAPPGRRLPWPLLTLAGAT